MVLNRPWYGRVASLDYLAPFLLKPSLATSSVFSILTRAGKQTAERSMFWGEETGTEHRVVISTYIKFTLVADWRCCS